MCAPIGGRSGPVGAHPQKDGALLERWRAQCGMTRSTIQESTPSRLESSFDQLRRFTADASHELRTPLSVIRGIGELGLRETRTPAEYKEARQIFLEDLAAR